jgi:hypothetical protein
MKNFSDKIRKAKRKRLFRLLRKIGPVFGSEVRR